MKDTVSYTASPKAVRSFQHEVSQVPKQAHDDVMLRPLDIMLDREKGHMGTEKHASGPSST